MSKDAWKALIIGFLGYLILGHLIPVHNQKEAGTLTFLAFLCLGAFSYPAIKYLFRK